MQQRLKKISAHSLAIHLALAFAILSLIFMLPFMFMMTSLVPNMPEQNAMPFMFTGAMTFVMPVFYFIFTYIFTLIMAFIYNLLAKLTGGVKVTLEASE